MILVSALLLPECGPYPEKVSVGHDGGDEFGVMPCHKCGDLDRWLFQIVGDFPISALVSPLAECQLIPNN